MRAPRWPILGLLAGLAAILLVASYYGHFLYQPGPYRALPWAHLGATPLCLAAAIWILGASRGHRWPRRATAGVGVLAAGLATVVLWLFVFVGSRLPDQGPPRLEIAPDFVLPDQEGDMVRLAALRERGPIVVAFYRGGFDRWAFAMLSDLERARPRVEAAGGRIVAISGDPRDESRALRGKLGLGYSLATDADLAVTKSWQVLGDAGRAPRPAIFVVDRTGHVRWLAFPASLRDLPDLGALVQAVEEAR